MRYLKMTVHSRIEDRNDWFAELWQEVKSKHKDEEIARIVFRRLVFEEK